MGTVVRTSATFHHPVISYTGHNLTDNITHKPMTNVDMFNCVDCGNEIPEIIHSGNTECTTCGKMNNIFEVTNNCKPIIIETTKNNKVCKGCGGSNIMEDEHQGAIVCKDCGIIQKERCIKDEADWSNYETDRSSGVDNSRVGWFDESNPYNQTGSTFRQPMFITVMKDGKKVVRDLRKLQRILGACNKEAAFRLVIGIFDKLTPGYGGPFSQRIVDQAKRFWGIIFKTGRIFRGGVRSGILASCIFYSCKCLHINTSKEQISQAMVISNDQFVKGEPIFLDILRQSSLKHLIVDAESFGSSSNRFNEIVCTGLGLEFKVSRDCNIIYELCEEELSEISTNAALAGVIGFYIQSHGLKISKKKIAEETKITNPTLVNAIKIVKDELITHKTKGTLPVNIEKFLNDFMSNSKK
jgi:transcription initiation factor TFIIIB Brf1 subunit/transcription initiation factor TFIIB